MNRTLFPIIRFRHVQLAAAAALAGIAGSVVAATGPSPDLTVRLMPEVALDTCLVKLGQVANVYGSTEAGPMGELVVADNVSPGTGLVIRCWKISELLSQAGYDMRDITLAGSAACSVRIVPDARDSGSIRPGSASLPVKLASKSGRPASLETQIRRRICRRLGDLPDKTRIKIDFNATVKPLLAMTDPPYTFKITARGTDRRLGLLNFTVELIRAGKLLKEVSILAKVQANAQVLVARRTINSRAVIGVEDVEKSWQRIKRTDRRLVTDPKLLADERAKRMIRPGTVITADLLEPRPLVKRGELVSVIYRRGRIEIKTIGLAMQTGFKDQPIAVRNERSKQTFRACPIKPGVVLVEARSPLPGPAPDRLSEVTRP